MDGTDSVDGADIAPASGFKTILLATDGSEFSMGTERVALDLAFQQKSHVFLLRMILSEADSAEATLEAEEAAQQLEQLGSQCAEREIPFTSLIRLSQDPSQGILSIADEVKADVVVIGRRGRRGLARFKVGDATSKVIDKAECTVMVVPRLVNFWTRGILMVSVPPQTGDAAVQVASRLALDASLPMTVLMATDDDSDSNRRESNQLVNRLVAIAKSHGVDTSGVVQSGKTDEVILEVARQRSADLIVKEHHDERSLVGKLFQPSTTIDLIGQAHCPVMVVKQPVL